jgi:hypothetical protein
MRKNTYFSIISLDAFIIKLIQFELATDFLCYLLNN